MNDYGDLVSADDYEPFEYVELTRVRDHEGEPTEWVVIEGYRQGGCREVRILYEQLLNQTDVHLQYRHGKSMDEPVQLREFAHATVRAAVAFLMD
jgi:hypothetical protein